MWPAGVGRGACAVGVARTCTEVAVSLFWTPPSRQAVDGLACGQGRYQLLPLSCPVTLGNCPCHVPQIQVSENLTKGLCVEMGLGRCN